MPDLDDAERLERLWSGDFGDRYADRNSTGDPAQARFWDRLIDAYSPASVLEVGCNVGINLGLIAARIGEPAVTGIDINESAMAEARKRLPRARIVAAAARELPFDAATFDLVLTMGVLIHQPDRTLPAVIAEMHRCSRKYILAGEYYAPNSEEVPYRGVDGALFRRNYGAIIAAQLPDVRLLESGFLGRDEGWDDVTWWLFEKPQPTVG